MTNTGCYFDGETNKKRFSSTRAPPPEPIAHILSQNMRVSKLKQGRSTLTKYLYTPPPPPNVRQSNESSIVIGRRGKEEDPLTSPPWTKKRPTVRGPRSTFLHSFQRHAIQVLRTWHGLRFQRGSHKILPIVKAAALFAHSFCESFYWRARDSSFIRLRDRHAS